MPELHGDAAAKAAAEKEAKERADRAKTDAAAAAKASGLPTGVVCLVRPTVIDEIERPRGYELNADDEVVVRALWPNKLVQPKALFDKIEAAEKAKAEAAKAEAAAESKKTTSPE